MSIRELVASYKTKFPAAFKSSAKAGGGATQSKSGGSKEIDFSKLTPTQMIQQAIKQGK